VNRDLLSFEATALANYKLYINMLDGIKNFFNSKQGVTDKDFEAKGMLSP